MGMRMMKVVPFPVSVSNVIVPPCFSTMTLCAMASPCPVPFPTPLVVKNGSKIFACADSGIPVPVSRMRISAQSPSRRVETVMVPLVAQSPSASAMACEALTMRLRTPG